MTAKITPVRNKKCPTCKSPLTLKEYERAMGLVKQKEIELKKARDQAKKLHEGIKKEKQKLDREKKKFLIEKKKNQEALKKKSDELRITKNNHKKEMAAKVKLEREKALRKQSIQIEKMKHANKKMKEQLDLAKMGRSEADLGFAEEQKLAGELRKKFPDDLIKVVGKGGDVLHTVRRKNKALDSIIYECKRVANHSTAHIDQTSKAISQQRARFGVLVTTGKTTKSFKGFCVEKGVSIVRPEAVLVVARILRDQIIEMDRLKIEEGKKNLIANRALKFLNSTNFKTPINAALKITDDNIIELNKEVKDHARYWKKRYTNYCSLSDQILLIRENSGRAIKGEVLQKLKHRKKEITITIPELK